VHLESLPTAGLVEEPANVRVPVDIQHLLVREIATVAKLLSTHLNNKY
jgi:hypothetical protein